MFLFRIFCFKIISKNTFKNVKNDLDSKIEKLHSTYNGKSSEKSHGSSNEWKHVYKLNCFILCDSIKGCGIKINLDKSELKVGLKILIKDVVSIRNYFGSNRTPRCHDLVDGWPMWFQCHSKSLYEEIDRDFGLGLDKQASMREHVRHKRAKERMRMEHFLEGGFKKYLKGFNLEKEDSEPCPIGACLPLYPSKT